MIVSFLTYICKVYFRWAGWKIKGPIPYHLKKYVVIVGPHTSAWDVPIGVAARAILALDIKFLAKNELFKFPWKNFMLKIGGVPVDRKRSYKLVDQLVHKYETQEKFALGLSPEGTRAYVKEWRSGFYHLAKKANIPVICAAMDYANKEIVIRPPYYISKDWQETQQELKQYYKQFQGKHPEKGIY